MASVDKWRWTDEEGVQRLLSADELRGALEDGRLEPNTLVWRKGMSSWLPAAEVPELHGDKAPDSGETFTQQHEAPSNIIDLQSLKDEASGDKGVFMSAGAKSAPLSSRPATTALDDQWDDGQRSGEDTVTRVDRNSLPDDDEATQARPIPSRQPPAAGVAAQPRKANGASRRESKRPPPPARKKGQVKQGVIAEERTRSQFPPKRGTVKSTEMLASNLSKDGAKQRAESSASVGPASGLPTEPLKVVVQLDANAEASSITEASSKEKLARLVQSSHQGVSKANAEAERAQRGQHQAAHEEEGSEALPGHKIATGMRAETTDASLRSEQALANRPSEPSFPVFTTTSSLRSHPWFAGSKVAELTGRWFVSKENVSLSRVSLFVGMVAIFVSLVVFFFVGRATSPPGPAYARSSLGAGLSAGLPVAIAKEERPCLMTRAPAPWARRASRYIPFELAPTKDGRIALGFASSSTQAKGLLLKPSTGEVEVVFDPEESEDRLSRVRPFIGESGVDFRITNRQSEQIRRAVAVNGSKPFEVGFDEAHVVIRSSDGEVKRMWPLAESERAPDALRVAVVEDRAVAVVYRLGPTIWFGWLGTDGSVLRAAEQVAGSGRRVGQPVIATHESKVVLVFANEPDEQDAVKHVRLAEGKRAEAMGGSVELAVPAGGPGGDSIAPAVTMLDDGRAVIMWTEGPRGERVLRAQTYDAAFEPLGGALRVSPATGNFGQGAVSVVGQDAAIAFLLAKGRGRYALWGTVLRCN